MSSSKREESPNHTPPEVSGLMLWADCEFTGTNPNEGHMIIEIGALVTDLALRKVEAYHSFIGYDWERIEGLMDQNPWWDDRMEDRLHMREGTASAPAVEVVDSELAGFVKSHFGSHRPPLYGNTIGNDQKHIESQLPRTMGQLSYRVVDVSSFKIEAQKFRGISYDEKRHMHHPLEDIDDSIAEYRFLMSALRITDFTEFLGEKL